MNRIILIGNGFDLAHGMKTGYKDFISDLWKGQFNFFKDFKILQKNKLIEISKGNSYSYRKIWDGNKNNYFDFMNYASYKNVDLIVNGFLELISKIDLLEKWVDVEKEFYELLLFIAFHDTSSKSLIHYRDTKIADIRSYVIENLNEEFEIIKSELEAYIVKIQNKFKDEVIPDNIYDSISRNINYKFNFNDFTTTGVEKLIEICLYNKSFKIDKDHSEYSEIDSEMFESLDTMEMQEKYKRMIPWFKEPDSLFKFIPCKYLFLNFNYTNTISKYINEYLAGSEIIHIHGQVKDEVNKMIFGYGDELCPNYKKIEELNNNQYLENIKSIKYLNTDNYKRLLNFIDSSPFQILIFGHSCGNSDRTLLNTIFEHENCYSIKPYYHQVDDKNDNYEDLVKNISRNFNDKKMMREKVVNKEYCEPLIPINQ